MKNNDTKLLHNILGLYNQYKSKYSSERIRRKLIHDMSYGTTQSVINVANKQALVSNSDVCESVSPGFVGCKSDFMSVCLFQWVVRLW